jgi:hypothetical protein
MGGGTCANKLGQRCSRDNNSERGWGRSLGSVDFRNMQKVNSNAGSVYEVGGNTGNIKDEGRKALRRETRRNGVGGRDHETPVAELQTDMEESTRLTHKVRGYKTSVKQV